MFRTWRKALPSTIEICPVQLPGRENRLREPPYTDMRVLAESLAIQLQPHVHKPFALFGHSMGALLGFELTRTLRRIGIPLPIVLFLSAHRAAHLPLRYPPLHQLSDSALLHSLRSLKGTPQGVFESQELLELILPTLRADFTLCENYHFVPEPPLDCPFVLYAGRADTIASQHDVAAWRQHTTQTAELELFSGGHFFIHSDSQRLFQTIVKTIRQLGEPC